MTPISKNFTLEEMLSSATAKDKKIDNSPTPEARKNIQSLVDNTLQPVRDLYGKNIHINSGYRCPALNKAVGGAVNSQHTEGKAADITTGGPVENRKLFDLILKSGISFDQLIDESNYKWIHISYNEGKNRKQVLHLK